MLLPESPNLWEVMFPDESKELDTIEGMYRTAATNLVIYDLLLGGCLPQDIPRVFSTSEVTYWLA